MGKRVLIKKSIRSGVRGPRLKIHLFIDGEPDWSVIFSPNETITIFKLLEKHLKIDTSIKTQVSRLKNPTKLMTKINISRKVAKNAEKTNLN